MRGRCTLMICGLLAIASWGCATRRGEADIEQLAPTGNGEPGTSVSDWAPPPPVQQARGLANNHEGAHAAQRQVDPAFVQRPPAAGAAIPAGSLPPPDAQSMQLLMQELQSLGTLAPADQARLMQSLRETMPEQWPLVIQSFRNQQAARAAEPEIEPAIEPSAMAATPPVAGRDPALAVDSAPTETIQDNAPPAAAASSTEPTGQPAVTPVAQEQAAAAAQPSVATAAPATSELATTPPASAAAAAEATASEPAKLDAAATAAVETPTTTADSTPETAAAEVVQASHEMAAAPPSADTALAAAITALETQLAAAQEPSTDSRRQLQLRMLYLAAGRRNDALSPMTGLSPSQQEYWSEQLYGLSVLLDEEKITEPARRAAESRAHLGQALDALGQEASLVVHRLNFCTEVNSYGVFTRMEELEFTPGQELLLYAEVENFHAEPSRDGFHTALKSSYQIFDSAGQRLAEHEFPITEEQCQNRRRDYFIRYFLSLPDRCYPGTHTLQLTIEDTLGKKIGQATIEFEVKEAASQRKITAVSQGNQAR